MASAGHGARTAQRAAERVSALRTRIRAVNARLLQGGSTLRVVVTDGPLDREALSCSLMAALQQTRDRDVFELLYELNVDLIASYCHARMRGALLWIEEEDVVVETFTRVFRYCDSFRLAEGSTFSGWAVVIAENVIRHAGRSGQRRRTLPLDAEAQIEDRSPDPLAAAMAEEIRRDTASTFGIFVALCAAGLLRLPARWREALELREGQGMSYAEIGVRLGLRPGTVGMMIRRARLRVLLLVRRALAPYEVDA